MERYLEMVQIDSLGEGEYTIDSTSKRSKNATGLPWKGSAKY